MTTEQIKTELIQRINILDEETNKKNAAAEGLDKAEVFFERYRNTDEYYRSIIDALNDILVENKIDFDSDLEKENFIDEVKPTIKKLYDDYLNGRRS